MCMRMFFGCCPLAFYGFCRGVILGWLRDNFKQANTDIIVATVATLPACEDAGGCPTWTTY